MENPYLTHTDASLFEAVESRYVTVRDEEYAQLLDEWAEIVYCYLCQLSEKKILAPEFSKPLSAESPGVHEE